MCPFALVLLPIGAANWCGGFLCQARLKQCEDDILNLLSSGTNLLEDEEVINTLDNSKRIADEIAVKQAEIESSQKICDKTRAKFVPVAQRGAILFFCITELANVDPMYQYALQWYIDLFQRGLRYMCGWRLSCTCVCTRACDCTCACTYTLHVQM